MEGNIEDIPLIPDQAKRLEAITLDCYTREEELAGFQTYFEDALHVPFAARWGNPDRPDKQHQVTVLGVESGVDSEGILLSLRDEGVGVLEGVPAEEVWAEDPASANAIVLDDYRAWGGYDNPEDWDDEDATEDDEEPDA